ncbi:allantoate amidohydrolase [Glycomyces harbinensis]|uniref:N-carbamoyl-L-amino-acid hydrolase n=1 Tax=Glycomyces harbinensis TaxID=58114 RepID=A0A1G6TRN7_9ACTN|nr:allantoate amidohydrolase [Glycomyces harbinensis]SDD31701.1 N-carbamoyl-L-amino-acid hydrolase [Glycomyces harbinensis]
MDGVDFRRLWDELAPIGRAEAGGYLRFSWSDADLACRDWFRAQAAARDLRLETDRNGNLFAWWDPDAEAGEPNPAFGAADTSPRTGEAAPAARPDDDRRAVLTGSHFDSVPHGGAYDGPLGIVSAFLAVDRLRAEGAEPKRPIVIGAFTEEEGGRFGVPCLGSRLMAGAIDPDRARALTDTGGTTLAQAMREAGADPDALGPDPERLANLGAFVELHIEQGRNLGDAPVGVASAIWPHGRWRLTFTGAADHAGTTRLPDRRDPMLTFAFAVLAARKEARLADGLATIGRVAVEPNATNAIAAKVTAWLDSRAADAATLEAILSGFESKVRDRAERDGTGFAIAPESETPIVEFDTGLRDRIATLLGEGAASDRVPGGARERAPVLPTGAGHDAGVLAAHVPTAMLFVRNPTGVSHAPGESASDEDCAAGVDALAAVLRDLAC